MIEEFVIKLEDGTEVRIAGELLHAKLNAEARAKITEAMKKENLGGLITKMSEQIKEMTVKIDDLQAVNDEAAKVNNTTIKK